MTSPLQPPSPPERQDISAAGDTKSGFMFLALRGSLVKVRLAGGRCLEGVFSSLEDKTGRVTLNMVFEWPSPQDKNPQEHAFCDFYLKELVSLTAEGVNFAELTGAVAGGSFATDADISRGRATGHGRELARWDSGAAEGAESALAGLEDESRPPGSHHWDQFATNEKLFGVVTSFDESAYTTHIDRASAEYKKLAQEAERLAREIESDMTKNPHLAEERGVVLDDSQIDEEDRYGAVVRNAAAGSQPVGSKETVAPVSYRQAAAMYVRSPSTGLVKMPSACTSSSSSAGAAAAAAGTSSHRPAQPGITANGKPPSPPPSSEPTQPTGKPRRSIINLQADPEALEEALEAVESSSQTMQRRLSQVVESDPQLASALQEQRRREMFEKHRKDTAQQFKAFSEQISTKLSVSGSETAGASPGSLDSPVGLSPVGLSPVGLSPVGLSTTGLSTAGSSTAGSSAGKLNPNAAEFVPTADVAVPSSFAPSLPFAAAAPPPSFYYNPYAMGYAPMPPYNAYYARPYPNHHSLDAMPMQESPPYFNPYQQQQQQPHHHQTYVGPLPPGMMGGMSMTLAAQMSPSSHPDPHSRPVQNDPSPD